MTDALLNKIIEIETRCEKKIDNLIRFAIDPAARPHFEEVARLVSPKLQLDRWRDGAWARVGGEAISLLVKDSALVFKRGYRQAVVKIAHWRIRESEINLIRFKRGIGIQAGIYQLLPRNVPDVFWAGDFFLVQQFAPGATLMEFSAKASVPELYDFFANLAKVLAKIHVHGIVHRDIKPQNILVGTDPLLLDWGYSAEWEEKDNLTPANQIIGTPLFLAESLQNPGVQAFPKHDIHALGAVIWCAFAGKIPTREIEYQIELLRYGDNLPKWSEVYQRAISGFYGNDASKIAADIESHLGASAPPSSPPTACAAGEAWNEVAKQIREFLAKEKL